MQHGFNIQKNPHHSPSDSDIYVEYIFSKGKPFSELRLSAHTRVEFPCTSIHVFLHKPCRGWPRYPCSPRTGYRQSNAPIDPYIRSTSISAGTNVLARIEPSNVCPTGPNIPYLLISTYAYSLFTVYMFTSHGIYSSLTATIYTSHGTNLHPLHISTLMSRTYPPPMTRIQLSRDTLAFHDKYTWHSR